MIVTVDKAARLIQSGEIVAIPTETVYGLAADAFNINAVKKTFGVKGRPADNPLIVHISDMNQLSLLTDDFPLIARVLAEKFWPGPLTLVLTKNPRVPDIVTAGLNTVAVRMPDHVLTRQLIEKTGPLTAPSANKSGGPSPTKAAHIESDYSGEIPVLDGGLAKIGLESTVADLSRPEPAILRPGSISAEMLTKATGIHFQTNLKAENHQKKSPGTRHSHYKPQAIVSWLSKTPEHFEDDTYYLFHSENPPVMNNNITSYNGDISAFARDLYDHFRTADHKGYSQILVESFKKNQQHPLIPALKDRINRAVS